MTPRPKSCNSSFSPVHSSQMACITPGTTRIRRGSMPSNKYTPAVLVFSLAPVIAVAMISVSGCAPQWDQPTLAVMAVPVKPEEKLPKDHPIYAAPNLLDKESRPDVRLVSIPYAGKAPVWTFALDKTRFRL